MEVTPPVLRYKSVNTKYKTQAAPEGSALANAMKRVPARVKALGGPILEDFLAIAAKCDNLEEKTTEIERDLEETRRREEGLNERLEEGRTNFDLLVTRFTNSVEQATQLRKQVDEERHDTSTRHAASLKQEKLLRDQVATLRRQIDGERMMATNYKKEHAALKNAVAEMERELAEYKTNDTVSGRHDPESRKDRRRKEEIKNLNAEVAGLREDLARQMEARRELERTMEQERESRESKDNDYQDMLRKYEATNRVLERTLEKLASANEFLDTGDALGHDDALARVISFNEEMTQVASLFAEKIAFLQDGEDDLPNPYQGADEEDLVHRFLSPRFPPLLLHPDLEKRRAFVELAIRACLVYFAGLILNSGCFGLREDMDQFLLQVWGIIQSDHVPATAGRWRSLTHHSIRSSPQFPTNRTLVTSMIKSLTTVLRMARCQNPEQIAEGWEDDLSSLHATIVALEVDFKEKVLSTTYIGRVVQVDSPFLAIEMTDVSVFMEVLRKGDTATHLKAGVKTVLACVSLGLSTNTGGPNSAARSRKSTSSKSKNDIRLEPTVLLDAVLP
ncbi:hypothetical protein M408DRAFT_331188 [Serendipita vermifera MAFF 305830]|uniref:Uncharacterized protein n=1 Tax=Serendipita vermifera MAFF 305830 TaxID=933852 RepID=A0A0C3AZN2_SERVB|nr:hypothetical protein M408DRAFT_331188 [Serendipita vermifera MAFF 305830]